MSYREHFIAHLRLTLLRCLSEAPGYRTNSSVLHSAAEDLGLPATRDQVRTELAWLAEQGLLRTEPGMGSMLIVVGNERGVDVACGRTLVPGVQRPGPGQ